MNEPGWVGLDLTLVADAAAAFEDAPEKLVRRILGGLAVALLEDLYGRFAADVAIDLDSPRNHASAFSTPGGGAGMTLHISARPERAAVIGAFAQRQWTVHVDGLRSELERRRCVRAGSRR